MVGAPTSEKPRTGFDFTVTSSSEELRYAARAGDLQHAQRILDRYLGATNPLNKLLKAVLAATDDVSGNSSLHLCCANGHIELVRLLLQHGAPLDTKNLSGSTPLHYASLTGHVSVVRELLDYGALAVVENTYGRTALDEAQSGGHANLAKMLMTYVESHGAAPDMDGAEQ